MPSSDNDEITAEYQLYSLNLGHLFTTFARLENLLNSALKLHLAMNIGPVTDNRAIRLSSAIYGAMRFKASRDTVKRILSVEDAPEVRTRYLDGVFEHLAHIENFRDKLAHQTVTPAHKDLGAYWQVNDATNTRDLRKLKWYVFDTSAVHLAADDLDTASHLLGKKPVTDRLFAHLDDQPPPAWRYRSSMLKLVPHSKLKISPE